MRKQKVLIFIDWFLPGTKSGGPVRSIANLIDHLGEEFEFLIVTRNTDYCEIKVYQDVKSDVWNRVLGNTKVFYISEKNLNYRCFKELITTTDFDLAYVNGIYSKFFSILPVYILRNTGKPILVAARGMLNPQAFSVKPAKKKIFLALMNVIGFYKNVSFHATNKDEAGFITNAVEKFRKVKVAPNLPRKVEAIEVKKRFKGDVTKLISVARVAREKGTLTTLRALSKMESSKSIVYDIFGSIYDASYWKKCKETIEKLPENIQVNYKDSVDGDKVPALLKDYHFFIMPSEGENYGHGIVEAFTAGCPVIISDKTPWKRLEDKKVGWDVSIEDPKELILALETAIAMDQEIYHIWSQQVAIYSRKIIDNKEILQANRNLFLVE